MTLVSGGTHTAYIMFADGTSGSDRYRGQIGYDHDDNSLAIYVNASESLSVNSTGNLGIGDTDPSEAKLSISSVASGDYALKVDQDQAKSGIFIAQDGNGAAIEIDTAATGNHAILVSAPLTETGCAGLLVNDCDQLTSGSAIQIQCASTTLATTASAGLVMINHTGNSSSNVNNLMFIKNDHASASGTVCLKIDQDANGYGLLIDSEATTEAAIILSDSQMTTGTVMYIADHDQLTTGKIANFHSASSDTGTRNLVEITNDHASSSGTTCLLIDQDATAGAGLTIDSEAQTNYCLGIVTPQTTTSTVFSISDANSLTSGSIATFESNSSSNTARRLVRIINDNAATDNAVGLHIQQDGNGASIELSGAGNCGIKFPATVGPSSDVNTLDDYEEGDWTPTMTFGGNSVSVAYAVQSGRYTKVGRLVQIECKLELSNNGSSTGAAAIGGLPFTPAGDSAGCGDTDNVSFANQLSFMIVGSAVLVYLNESTEGGARTTITEGEVANDAQIRIMVTYVV
jgi:hypothetical protein